MKLKDKLEKKKNQIGLVGTKLNFSQPSSGKGISEYITQDFKEIVIRIREDLNLIPNEKTKEYLDKISIKEPLEVVAEDMLYHGCGHRELPTETKLGCPYNLENHDLILDGIAKGLKEKGKNGIILTSSNGEKQSLECYIANAFEDLLDNTNARRNTRHAGQILFWNNEGLENNSNLGDFYEAFVKLNLNLWGNVQDFSLLKSFFKNSEKAQKAVKQFKNDLSNELNATNLVKLYEKEDLFRKLFDKSKWNKLAYKFTLALADLIDSNQDKNEMMRLCLGSEGESYFDKLLKIPSNQEDLAFGRYKKGLGKSEHTDPLLQLDSLYRKISKQIPVETSEYVKSQGIPISYFGKRNLEEDEDIQISRVRGIGFNDDGDLTLKVSQHEIRHPTSYKVHPRNFPKLRVALIDRSGSMKLSPDDDENIGNNNFVPWGDNSKYHYALKGLYGIDNFLEKQGITAYTECETITFSNDTKTTGKIKFRDEKERRALLKMPSGGTVINPNLFGNGERSFLISISDGDIQNWDSIKDDYISRVKKMDYCHIHIGNENEFTKDLEKEGIKVKYVHGDEDLSRLMVNVASAYYRGFK